MHRVHRAVVSVPALVVTGIVLANPMPMLLAVVPALAGCTGAHVEVYEWRHFSDCVQYVSYEFLDGRLVFRRYAPPS